MLIAVAFAVSALRTILVETVATTEASSAAFQTCLAGKALPKWREMRSHQLVSNHVYRKTGQQNGQPGVDWSFLIVSGLRSSNAAPAVARATGKCTTLRGVSQLDQRLMRPTPASYYPAPRGRSRRSDLAFVVEFIAVRPTALSEYGDTMRSSIGPAVGRLVRDNQFYSMTGLETVRVLKSRQSDLPWNQLHIRGTSPEVGITPAAMTRYMLEANPTLGDFRTVFKRLDAIRAKPRDDFARELQNLAL